jgi:hypothetical protein
MNAVSDTRPVRSLAGLRRALSSVPFLLASGDCHSITGVFHEYGKAFHGGGDECAR